MEKCEAVGLLGLPRDSLKAFIGELARLYESVTVDQEPGSLTRPVNHIFRLRAGQAVFFWMKIDLGKIEVVW